MHFFRCPTIHRPPANILSFSLSLTHSLSLSIYIYIYCLPSQPLSRKSCNVLIRTQGLWCDRSAGKRDFACIWATMMTVQANRLDGQRLTLLHSLTSPSLIRPLLPCQSSTAYYILIIHNRERGNTSKTNV